jgi:5-methylcytosine-specific restriction endonuclease McrA
VFERDGYRCHLCKRMTLRTAAVPHPRAPVIDHLIPLGPGADARHNVATACFLCNSMRRDVGPAQLILFG